MTNSPSSKNGGPLSSLYASQSILKLFPQFTTRLRYFRYLVIQACSTSPQLASSAPATRRLQAGSSLVKYPPFLARKGLSSPPASHGASIPQRMTARSTQVRLPSWPAALISSIPAKMRHFMRKLCDQGRLLANSLLGHRQRPDISRHGTDLFRVYHLASSSSKRRYGLVH